MLKVKSGVVESFPWERNIWKKVLSPAKEFIRKLEGKTNKQKNQPPTLQHDASSHFEKKNK